MKHWILFVLLILSCCLSAQISGGGGGSGGGGVGPTGPTGATGVMGATGPTGATGAPFDTSACHLKLLADSVVGCSPLTLIGDNVLMNPDGGNVGIGISNPSYPLHIVGAGTNTGYGINQLAIVSPSSEAGLIIDNSGTGGVISNIFTSNNSSGVGGGNLVIGDVTNSLSLVTFDLINHVQYYGQSNNSNARMTLDNANDIFDFNSNDSWFNLNGSTRLFQMGDWTNDWYNTSLKINDDASIRQIFLQATNGVKINNSYVLPLADGTAGQVMTTDGAGTVSFSNVASPDSLFWHTGNGNLYQNDTTLNVGIGTTMPNANLDVESSQTTPSTPTFLIGNNGNPNTNTLITTADGSNSKLNQIAVDSSHVYLASSNDIGTLASTIELSAHTGNIDINSSNGGILIINSSVGQKVIIGAVYATANFQIGDTTQLSPTTFRFCNGIATVPDGYILTSRNNGYLNWSSLPANRGMPVVLDSLTNLVTGSVTITNNAVNIITGSGAITGTTINFPVGADGDEVVIIFERAITTITSGTNTGSINFPVAGVGISRTFKNYLGNWH